jgi:glycosyltransferase involved in cell wall biosynthesis
MSKETINYPNVSILMPTYNRNKFLKLVLLNIYNMDYDKKKLEWVILDDGPEPFFKDKEEEEHIRKLLSPIKIRYIYDPSKHLKIGDKRNKLVKLASYKTCAFMDDDDIYYNSYIKHSVEILLKNKVGLVGSNAMLFTFPHHNYNMSHIQCQAKRQIHEATMCFTKNYFRAMPGFLSSSLGEGAKMIDHNEKNCAYTDISKVMICVPHNDNTFNKEQFYKFRTHIRFQNNIYFEALYEITGIKYDEEKSNKDFKEYIEMVENRNNIQKLCLLIDKNNNDNSKILDDCIKNYNNTLKEPLKKVDNIIIMKKQNKPELIEEIKKKDQPNIDINTNTPLSKTAKEARRKRLQKKKKKKK